MDREEFMSIVYDELHSDGDNTRANRIIDAADEYAESTQLPPTSEDTISRQACLISRKDAINLLESWKESFKEAAHKESASDILMIIKDFKKLPAAQPKTAKIKVIRSECGDLCGCECGTCGVSLDFVDNYCWRCGAKLIKEVSK